MTARVVLLPLAAGAAAGAVAGVILTTGVILLAADSVLRAWGWLRG